MHTRADTDRNLDLPVRERQWVTTASANIAGGSGEAPPGGRSREKATALPKAAIAVATMTAWISERYAADMSWRVDPGDVWLVFAAAAIVVGALVGLVIRFGIPPGATVACWLVVAGWFLGWVLTAGLGLSEMPAVLLSPVALALALMVRIRKTN